MWGWINHYAQGFNEAFYFKTEEELKRFHKMYISRMMEEYPNEPEMWTPDEREIYIFKVNVITPEEALKTFFE